MNINEKQYIAHMSIKKVICFIIMHFWKPCMCYM